MFPPKECACIMCNYFRPENDMGSGFTTRNMGSPLKVDRGRGWEGGKH